MKVTLEAVVGFVTRVQEKDKDKEKGAAVAAKVAAASTRALMPRKPAELTANDRRFLRSLRIAADEAKVGGTDLPA
jgi:hypothetical protein